jgi:Tfp pilus tip-associated adhesin PilY1
MQTNKFAITTRSLTALLVLATLAAGTHAGTTQLATSPLSGASSQEISPNIMFAMDDSLSMSWDYLPDWAGGKNNSDGVTTIPIALWQARNSGFNGIAYNPGFTYAAPVHYTSTGDDTTTYPTQSAANTANWTIVRRNPFSATDTTTVSLVGNAYYYATEPGEYCTNASMRSCSTTSTAFPAKLRWCNSAVEAVAAVPSANACQATEVDNSGSTDKFGYPRMPAPRTSMVTISGGGDVSSLQVNGFQILSAVVPSQSDSTSLASAIADSINTCTFGVTGATFCQVVGYRASSNANILTIYAPGAVSYTPAIVSSPSLTASAFARPTANLAPGENLLTVITSTTATYLKASGTRSDCAAATTCTYAEEMTNYANWYAYYRTRMQTMKSAASHAFSSLGSAYRVGFISINNKTGTSTMGDSFLNIAGFDATQKFNWYSKLFSAVPNGDTPLRLALARVGQIYGKQLTGTYNGHLIKDPVQYSCQQNVTILSTDGYWNDAAGFKLDGSTAVGNQDSVDSPDGSSSYGVVRAQLDGGSPIWKRTTTQNTQIMTPTVATWVQNKVDTIQSQQKHLQKRTKTQAQEETFTLQKQISTLQTQSAPLQSSTSQLRTRTKNLQQSLNDVVTISTLSQLQTRTKQIQKSTYSAQAQEKTRQLQYKQSLLKKQTSKLQISTSTLQQQTSTLQISTSNLQRRVTQVQQRTSSNAGTSWSSWSSVASCIPVINETQCQLLAVSGWSNVSSCTVATLPTADNPHIYNPGTDSQYTLYTTKSECQYTTPTTPANTASCIPAVASANGGNGTVLSVGTATTCTYTSWTTAANAASCQPLARSSGAGTWSVGTATQCSYTTPTSYVDATATCTTTPQSSGTGNWTVATANTCQYSTWTSLATAATCAPAAQTGASPFAQLTATACSWASWDASWQTATGACTPLAQASGGGTWSGPAMQCQYAAQTASWANVGSCTLNVLDLTTNFTQIKAQTACQTISAWTTPANAPSCAADANTACTFSSISAWSNTGSCTGSTSGTGLVTECQTVWTTPVAGACVANATTVCGTTWGPWNTVTSCPNNGTTSKCQYVASWSGYSNVTGPSTCTIQTASSGTGTWAGPQRECNYGAGWTGYANDATCNALAQSTGSANGTVYTVNIAKQCAYGAYSALVNAAGTCTVVSPSTANPYVATATKCQWTDGAWNSAGSCNVVAKTGGAVTYSQLSATQCQYSGSSGWSDVGSCAQVLPSSGPSYTVGTARNCQFTWTPYSDTSACTAVTNDTECQYGASSWVSTPSGCTLLPAQTVSPYTVDVATLACQTTPVSGWGPAAPVTNVATAATPCVVGPSGANTVSCQTVMKLPTAATPVETCTPVSDDGTAEHNQVTCPVVTTGPDKLATCLDIAATVGNNWTRTDCQDTFDDPTPDTLADVAQYYHMSDLRTSALGNCTGGDIVTGSVVTNNDVCANNLVPSGDSTADWQHMGTYTLGLGASGLMQYDAKYRDVATTSGDYYSVKNGVTADPGNGVCSWQSRGACNWPKPVSNLQTNIDDLWHAAVNGRGSYFSAQDPSSLAAGISNALANISVKDGALSSVTVTSPNLAAGDNGVFELSFKAGEWTGDLVKRTIDGTTGVLSSGDPDCFTAATTRCAWTAKSKLEAKVVAGTHTARSIYTFNSGGESASGRADQLKPFLWANLTTAEQDYFLKPHISPLTQFCTTGTVCLNSATQTSASGESLVKFLRGEKTNEGNLATLTAYYRERTNLLGDIVGSEAVYVKTSPWNYADNGYTTFRAANATRTGMVYVGANDGMLHALNSATGQEEWAYIPALVVPKLYVLADKNYPSNTIHQFFVDGTPTMGDICVSNCASGTAVWKTILVGGLNNGGRGYYALDITDPAAPKALWEFTGDTTDPDLTLGFTYGNPVITKLDDGTWTVMVTSGYNNVVPGDGKGRLFVLNAATGAIIRTISTGEGSTTTPSGLARISAWANFPESNNTAQRVYGGDLLGNLWRFDVNGKIPEGAAESFDAQRLATLKEASGAAQPITSKPELGKIKDKPVVFVATGQLLGTDDLGTAQQQTLYAIKDRLTAEDYGSPRPLTTPQTIPVPGVFVAQAMTAGTCPTGSLFCTAGEAIVTGVDCNGTVKPASCDVNFTINDGWYTDFPVAGERVNTDIRLQLGTLAFNTNAPKAGSCVPVGVSYAYFFDYRTGTSVEGTSGLLGVKLGDYLGAAPSVIRLEDGTIRELVRTDLPGTLSKLVPTAPTLFDTRRVSWRELVTE